MRQILTADDLNRLTKRIAHEIVEGNQGLDDVVILGIPTRGRPFADRLARDLSGIVDRDVTAGSVDIVSANARPPKMKIVAASACQSVTIQNEAFRIGRSRARRAPPTACPTRIETAPAMPSGMT